MAHNSRVLHLIVTLPRDLLCGRDILGIEAEAAIGGIECIFAMPCAPHLSAAYRFARPRKKPISSRAIAPLEAPTNFPAISLPLAGAYSRPEDPFWGYCVEDKETAASVTRFSLTFGSETPQEKIREVVRTELSSWVRRFCIYFEIFTGNSLTEDARRAPVLAPCSYYVDAQGQQLMLDIGSTIGFPPDTRINLFEKSHIERVLSATASGKDPNTEFRLLREAYRALRNGDYRKAVFEACGGIELLLVELISEKLADMPTSFGQRLLKKFSNLGGTFELAALLGIGLPTGLNAQALIESRNHVVHRAHRPDKREAEDVIGAFEALLGHSPRLVC